MIAAAAAATWKVNESIGNYKKKIQFRLTAAIATSRMKATQGVAFAFGA